MTYNGYLNVATDAIMESGKILLKYFRKNNKIVFKEDNSPVTIADTESEKNIIKILTNKFPNHSILGEESGSHDNDSEYLWVIDPLDGTSNFSNEIPYFCISIGLLHHKKPVVAAIYDPTHEDLFTATKDGGAYLNGKKLDINDFKNNKTSYISLVYTRSSQKKDVINKIFSNLNPPKYRMRNMGAAALELAYVASGKTQGIIINGNNPWDVCAGILLIQEAGGLVSDFNNQEWTFNSESIIAAPKKVHENLRLVL